MPPYRVIGRPAPRNDGVEKVTGRARYTADTVLPGTLCARALRSPYPHARIVDIDTSKASALLGVHAVLTGADVKGVLYGRRLRDVPVLAHEVVRFVGERVAGVAADDLRLDSAVRLAVDHGHDVAQPAGLAERHGFGGGKKNSHNIFLSLAWRESPIEK
jgi:CO/xanthine dehydrogenase Mo-binding subunit